MSIRILFACSVIVAALARSAVAEPPPTVPNGSTLTEADLQRQIAELTEVVRKGPPQFSLIGTLRARSGSVWEMNGLTFTVTDATEVYGGELRNGISAEVIGYMENGKPSRARKIIIRGRAPSADRAGERAASQHEAGAASR